jgi:hypothetical protein
MNLNLSFPQTHDNTSHDPSAPPHRKPRYHHHTPLTLSPSSGSNRKNGRHRPPQQLPLLYRPPPLNSNLQHHKPARELLPKILPVPRPHLAATQLRRYRAPAQWLQARLRKRTCRRRRCRRCLRPVPQGSGVCACEDGGGANRRKAARTHYQFECDADASQAGNC